MSLLTLLQCSALDQTAPIEAAGEVQIGFTAGFQGFEFVFFPDAGQGLHGMYLVDRTSAEELFALASTNEHGSVRVELEGFVEEQPQAAPEEAVSEVGTIHVDSFRVI